MKITFKINNDAYHCRLTKKFTVNSKMVNEMVAIVLSLKFQLT